MSINSVCIAGNLTRDAELRQTKSGTAVLQFSLAVNDRRKNAQGEWEDYPNYIDCILFGNLGTAIQVYMAKGAKVAVEGKLRQSRWQAKDGSNRSKLEVIAEEVELMTRANQQQAPAQATPAQAPAPAAQPAPVQPMTGVVTDPVPAQPVVVEQGSIFDDDLPF